MITTKLCSMKTHVLNSKDKLTVKTVTLYDDGIYATEYVKHDDVFNEVMKYVNDKRIVYLYTQYRPFRSTRRHVWSDKTEALVKRLEVEAEPYIVRMNDGRVGRGKNLSVNLKDARASLQLIKIIRRVTGWQAPSGRSVTEYYRRLECYE